MCFGGKSSPPPENKGAVAEIPARKMNQQGGPEDAEGEIGDKNAEDVIDKKKKGRGSLRIPLIEGTSGVQTE
tara:strand:- start:472 stop:687 length:216 start_codon:yes stop_codon:yes gene_type:complete